MTQWSAIVYGRTFVADRWWRALPRGLSPAHWSAKVMLDTVAGGRGLILQPGSVEDKTVFTPRTVLARGPDGTLVGIACRARMLDPQMCTDPSGRELYSFVGWFAADARTREIPPLAELASATASWVGAAYREYTGPVWTSPGNRLEVIASDPGPAPWPGTTAGQPSGAASGSKSPLTGSSEFVFTRPAADAEFLWDLASQAAGPFVVATGWQQARHASLERITHLCADDVTKAAALRRPVAATVRDREVAASERRSVQDPAGATDSGIGSSTDSGIGSQGGHEPAGPQRKRDERRAKGKHPRRGTLADALRLITGGADESSEAIRRPTGPLEQSDDGNPANADGTDVKPADARTAGEKATDPGAAASETSQTADPSARNQAEGRPVVQPPVQVELPKTIGGKKPFEGLDG
jgi:hypothetical protein